MKKICTWLIGMSCLLALAGTTFAGAPTMTLLLLPQLFGQEPGRDLPKPTYGLGPVAGQAGPNGTTQSSPPIAVAPPTVDDVTDGLLDLADLLLDRTFGCWVNQILRPCAPYNLAVDAISTYLSVMDSADPAGSTADATNDDGIGSRFSIVIGVRAIPRSSAAGAASGSEPPPATSAAPACPFAACPKSTPADACVGSGCCEAAKTLASSAKACKCCEGCEDCKDCTCKKKAVLSNACPQSCPAIGVFMSGVPMAPPPMPSTSPNPPPFATMPMMIQMTAPQCGPELLHYPQAVPFGACPIAQQSMYDVPLYPVEALKELIQQRQAITRAIEEIERELMQMSIARQQQQISVMQAAHSAQKVHLATEFFEAHCDTLRSVGENVMVLEGDVRLTSKKGGRPIRIEAARVLVNMQDGTFKVESAATVGTTQAPPMMMEPARMVEQPQLVLPYPYLNLQEYLNLQGPGYPPLPPLPQNWQPAPYRIAPPPPPAAPVPNFSSGIR